MGTQPTRFYTALEKQQGENVTGNPLLPFSLQKLVIMPNVPIDLSLQTVPTQPNFASGCGNSSLGSRMAMANSPHRKELGLKT